VADTPKRPVLPTRPKEVKFGIAMTVFGAAILAFIAVSLFFVDAKSPYWKNTDPADIPGRVQTVHGLGLIFVLWAWLLVSFAAAAFVGYRWGGLALGVMTIVWAVLALPLLFGGYIGVYIPSVLWGLSATALCRFRPAAREWYAEVAKARSVRTDG
jgi:hypothetical protein